MTVALGPHGRECPTTTWLRVSSNLCHVSLAARRSSCLMCGWLTRRRAMEIVSRPKLLHREARCQDLRAALWRWQCAVFDRESVEYRGYQPASASLPESSQ
ncbi:hypothetical protein IF1G_11095 [Cordyceps javanica]|uniref:Uncharacterized protein n=1 Tax=Cordyceps javanica TaxID=43265 RepID=A0A545ULC1_9HYPO|nr:hypothetical protein IF1G_11095 [Cordyceps javanica]